MRARPPWPSTRARRMATRCHESSSLAAASGVSPANCCTRSTTLLSRDLRTTSSANAARPRRRAPAAQRRSRTAGSARAVSGGRARAPMAWERCSWWLPRRRHESPPSRRRPTSAVPSSGTGRHIRRPDVDRARCRSMPARPADDASAKLPPLSAASFWSTDGANAFERSPTVKTGRAVRAPWRSRCRARSGSRGRRRPRATRSNHSTIARGRAAPAIAPARRRCASRMPLPECPRTTEPAGRRPARGVGARALVRRTPPHRSADQPLDGRRRIGPRPERRPAAHPSCSGSCRLPGRCRS
jgi:hypothetical protein